MRRVATVLVLLVCGSTSAQDASPKPRPLAPSEAGKLIELLGSRDYRERERAGKALSVEGERVLPQLKAALGTIESPEVQRRLEVLIDRVNEQRVFRPTPITVGCKNASVKDVLADICKQAGYKLQDGGVEDKKITLELNAVPFWEAMGAVADLAGVTVQPQDDVEKTIYAYSNDTFSPHNSLSGPFKFTASNIGSSRSIQLLNLPRRGQLSNPEYIGMGVQIVAEPKLPLVGIGDVTLVKAIDDKGTSLIPPAAEENRRAVRMYVAANYRSLNQSCSINLVRGSRDATSIRELEAKVSVAILVEERPEIAVENLLGAAKKKFAGTSLDLEIIEVTEAMGAVTLKIVFRQRDANPDDYNWGNTALQRLVVLDDAGAKLVSSGTLEQTNGPGVLAVTIAFSPQPGKKAGKPAKLILNEWITQTREIAFKFKDIPLP